MRSKITAILIILSTVYTYDISSRDVMLEKWGDYADSGNARLMISWLKAEVHREFEKGSRKKQTLKEKDFLKNTPNFFGRLGIFVTLVMKGKVRGCYGAFSHSSVKIDEVLISYLRGALRYDPRYTPLSIEEIDDVDIIITVTTPPYQVNDLGYIDISTHGVGVAYGDGSTRIFVPAEIKTHSYMMRTINRGNITNLFTFKSITIRKKGASR